MALIASNCCAIRCWAEGPRGGHGRVCGASPRRRDGGDGRSRRRRRRNALGPWAARGAWPQPFGSHFTSLGPDGVTLCNSIALSHPGWNYRLSCLLQAGGGGSWLKVSSLSGEIDAEVVHAATVWQPELGLLASINAQVYDSGTSVRPSRRASARPLPPSPHLPRRVQLCERRRCCAAILSPQRVVVRA